VLYGVRRSPSSRFFAAQAGVNAVRDEVRARYGNSGLSVNLGLRELAGKVHKSAIRGGQLPGSRISGNASSLGRASATTSSVEWTPNFDMRFCR
jgi:hypothetical protein